MPSDLATNLTTLNQRIAAACRDCRRNPGDVTLVAVSKTKPLQMVLEAHQLGLREFAENYVDEAVGKVSKFNRPDVIWHFIGRIQSNKTRLIAQHFDWVHTVDREKIARRLSEQCPQSRELQVLLQINIDDDQAKAGVKPAQASALARQVSALPHLKLRGLMTILSANNPNPRDSYLSMAQLLVDVRDQLPMEQQPACDVLSMGMTRDLEDAIAAGATHIRIGTALFGARETT